MKSELVELKILDLFSSIQGHSLKSLFFNFLSSIFEYANLIVVIDIVFNYKREFLNLTYPVYFISPIFYLEFFLNNLVKNSDLGSVCHLLNEEYYKRDQINRLIQKFFTNKIYNQNCFYDTKILRVIILLILLISLIIHMININNFFFSLLKYILSFITYFFLRTINLLTLVIFHRNVIIQLSDYYETISESFILDLALLIFFLILYIIFMNLLIYAFFENNISYLHNQNFASQEILLQELSSIIFILRLYNKKIIVIEFFWAYCFINFSILKIQDMLLSYNFNTFFKMNQIVFLILITFFIERVIIYFLIHWKQDEKVFKLLELCLLIFLFITLLYLLYGKKKYFQLYSIKEYLKKKRTLFFYGISQIFLPITNFFEIKLMHGKISGKEREIIDIYIKYFKNHLFKNENDFNILGNEKDKLIPLFSGKIKKSIRKSSSLTSKEGDSEKIIYNKLLYFLKYFKKLLSNDKNEFNRKVLEILHYYKIQLFFIIDDKTFRAQYHLQNFRYSKVFSDCPFISKCIFKSIRTSLLSLEKKSEDNSMASIIIFQDLNNQYIKILKCFKLILNNLTETKYRLYEIIDQKSSEIKRSLDEIIEINKHADDEYKLRSQPEFDKFQLIEEILFNDNSGKNFDFYDTNSLDTVVEKNDSFLILFERNEFIIKKAPLPFYEYTKKNTNKLKDLNLKVIFPSQIAKNQIKIIKKHLLKERHYTIETVIEDINGYIVGTKLHFSILPTFQGQIYIICKVDSLKDFEMDNFALFEKENAAIKFGTFFKDYFGVTNEHNSVPIIQLFGIKNYSFNDIEKEFVIHFKKLCKLVKKNFEKFYSNSKANHEKNLSKLEKILGNNKTLTLEIKLKNKFKEENQDFFLLQFNILELIKVKKQKKNIIETQETTNLYTPSIRDTASVASAISTRLHKENAWNISTQAKKKQKSENNIFSSISFCYSVFLIGFAVFICIYTKIYSNKFKKDYTNISVFRRNNIDFVYGQFCLTNTITKKTSGNPFDDLVITFSKLITNFSFDFFHFYLEIFQNSSIEFFSYQNEFKKQFGKLSNKNSFYNVLYEDFTIFNKDGNYEHVTYFDSFDVIFTNLYTISQELTEVMRFPQITYEQIPTYINNITEPNKTCAEILYNYPTFFVVIEKVIYKGKQYFNSSFQNFKFLIYLFFILFLVANIFGIIIILLSINLSTTILRKITKQIISITHKQLKSLRKKLKYGKLLLSNEKKPSSIIDEIKRIYAYNRAKKKQQLNSTFIDGNPNKVMDEDNDDYIPVVNLNKKEKKYYFQIFINSIENLLFSLLLYGILVIVTFPLMKTHFSKISTQKNLTDYIDDLNIYLIHFLIQSKISILFNTTFAMDDLINNKSLIIYNNYTEFASIIEKKEDYSKLISDAGSVGACESVLTNLENSIYYTSLIQICKVNCFFEARFSTKLSGFLSKIRSIYLAFLNDRNRNDYSYIYYAGYDLQLVNLFEYIFYMTFLGRLEEQHIKPDLEGMINNLTEFILVIFIIMIIFQIFNYVQGSFIILERFVQIIEVYNVIGKFFEMNDKNDKDNEKK